MQPKLKENPRDWQKFTAAVCVVLALLTLFGWRRRMIQPPLVWGLLGMIPAVLLVCSIRPAWFRTFYRAGMTLSFYIGQVVGRVLLTILFLVVVTPLGLGLRLLGKDLLALRPPPFAQSYWQSPKRPHSLDQQF